MSATAQLSVSWEQALSWRLSRHLLDPVGAESAAGVVLRLGAVLSRTRRWPSSPCAPGA